MQTPGPRNYSKHLEVKWNQESKHLMLERRRKKGGNNNYSPPEKENRHRKKTFRLKTFPTAVFPSQDEISSSSGRLPLSPHNNWEMGCAPAWMFIFYLNSISGFVFFHIGEHLATSRAKRGTSRGGLLLCVEQPRQRMKRRKKKSPLACLQQWARRRRQQAKKESEEQEVTRETFPARGI